MSGQWKIIQVFNNNVVLAEREDQRAVLLGRGIGFQRTAGASVPGESVHEVFSPSPAEPPEHLATLLTELPEELIGLSRELAGLAAIMCQIDLPDSTVIALADHIRFAVQRAIDGAEMSHPLEWEVRQLYPREFEFGRSALVHVQQTTGVRLDETEAVALALHVVNAQFTTANRDGANMALTARVTALLTQVLDLVDMRLPGPIDRSSMAAARFVTHLRYLLRRMLERGPDVPGPHDADPPLVQLSGTLQEQYPAAYRIASNVLLTMEMNLNIECSEDEVVYLTLHIARLMSGP